MKKRVTLERGLLLGAGVLLLCIVIVIAWPPFGGDRATMAGVAQAVSTLYAVVAALLIATNDRRHHEQALLAERTAERHAFTRRRDFEHAAKLLQIIEVDRRALAADPRSQPRSDAAAGLLLIKSDWASRALDYYVHAVRNPKSRYAPPRNATLEDFDQMQQEIITAMDKADFEDRR